MTDRFPGSWLQPLLGFALLCSVAPVSGPEEGRQEFHG